MKDEATSRKQADDALRDKIGDMLKKGLDTEIWPRAETSDMVNTLVGRLQTEARNDLVKKLTISGFSDYTIETDGIEQPCESCMYYVVHRKFCELPELMLPVEAHWSCRLWRI